MGKIGEGIVPEDMRALYREAGFGGRRLGFGRKPVVLVVDMQYGTIGDRPEAVLQSIAKYPSSVGAAGWAAVPKIAALLSAARKMNVPVIYTGIQREAFDKDVWKSKMSTKLAQSVLPGASQQQGPAGTDFVKEIAPREREIIITKKRTSAFFGTTLIAYLNKFQADTLIITGGATSSCIHNTVVDASQNNYHVIVVEECVFDRHPFIHAVSLFDIDAKWCDVVPLADVTAYMEALPAGA